MGETTLELLQQGLMLTIRAVGSKIMHIARGGATNKRLKDITEEYKARSFGTPSTELSPQVFDDKIRIDEIIAHCKRGTLADEELASLLINNDKTIPVEDTAAREFAIEYINAVKDALFESLSPDSQAIVAAIRGEVANSAYGAKSPSLSNTAMQFDELGARLWAIPDDESALILELLFQNGWIASAPIRNLKISTENSKSLAARFLHVYACICMDAPVQLEHLAPLLDNDFLLSRLAEVAISAGDYNLALDILTYSPSDTNDIETAVKHVIAQEPSFGPLSEKKIDEDYPFLNLALLLSAEYSYRLGNYLSVGYHLETFSLITNPLFDCHALIAGQYERIIRNASSDNTDSIDNLLSAIPEWAGSALLREFETCIHFCMDGMRLGTIQECIERHATRYPDLKHEIDYYASVNCADGISPVMEALDWANQNQRIGLFESAMEKMLSMDSSQAPYFKDLLAEEAWLQTDAQILCVFMDSAPGLLTIDEFEKYLQIYPAHPLLHLTGYSYFKETDPAFALEQIETAITHMKMNPSSSMFRKSNEWIAYLYENNRQHEIPEIVIDILPQIRARELDMFIRAINAHDLHGKLLDEMLMSLKGKEIIDPESNLLLANHYFFGQDEQRSLLFARYYACKAFKAKQTLQAATIIIQSGIGLHLDLHADAIELLKVKDNSLSNLLLAISEEYEGDTARRDIYFKRSILQQGDNSSEALYRYGMSLLMEPSDETLLVDKVRPDIWVSLSNENDETLEYVFHGESDCVSQEGCESYGAYHYTANSETYLQLMGKKATDKVCTRDGEFTIDKIAPAKAFFINRWSQEAEDRPDVKMLQLDPDNPKDMISKIKDSMPGADMSTILEEGLQLDDHRLFLGIESGTLLIHRPQLEYTLPVLFDPNIPFWRSSRGFNDKSDIKMAHTANRVFLLSYNAIVLIAQLNLNPSLFDSLAKSAVVASSTARRLYKDARQFAEIPQKTVGQLIAVDDELAFAEHNDVSKEDFRKNALSIIDTLSELTQISPVVSLEADMAVLSAASTLSPVFALDINTASANNMVYVTEDKMHADLLDTDEGIGRCSVQYLLQALGTDMDTMFHAIERYKKWSARPLIDIEIASEFMNMNS